MLLYTRSKYTTCDLLWCSHSLSKSGHLVGLTEHIASGESLAPKPTVSTRLASTPSTSVAPNPSISFENLFFGLNIKMYSLQFPVVSMCEHMDSHDLSVDKTLRSSVFGNDYMHATTYSPDWNDASFAASSKYMTELRSAWHIMRTSLWRNVLRFMGNTAVSICHRCHRQPPEAMERLIQRFKSIESFLSCLPIGQPTALRKAPLFDLFDKNER